MSNTLTVPPAGKTYSIVPSGKPELPWLLTMRGEKVGEFVSCDDALAQAAHELRQTPKHTAYRIVSLDTETTGVDDDDEVWEIGLVVRDPALGPDGDREFHAFVEHDLARAERLPDSFRADHDQRYDASAALSKAEAGAWLREILTSEKGGEESRPLFLLGAIPSFDQEKVKPLFRLAAESEDEWPLWHYRLQCIESIARGYLMGRGIHVPLTVSSDDLVAMTGFVVLGPNGESLYDRHTALSDAQWALDWYDHMTS